MLGYRLHFCYADALCFSMYLRYEVISASYRGPWKSHTVVIVELIIKLGWSFLKTPML